MGEPFIRIASRRCSRRWLKERLHSSPCQRSWADATDCLRKNSPRDGQAVFDNFAQPRPKNHFTVGIHDDVGLNLEYDPAFSVEPDDVFRAVFYGLGADGTVGANKDTIKIIGENTDNYAQAWLSMTPRSPAMTVSHLRFGPRPIPLELSDQQGELHWLSSPQFSKATTCSRTLPRRSLFL